MKSKSKNITMLLDLKLFVHDIDLDVKKMYHKTKLWFQTNRVPSQPGCSKVTLLVNMSLKLQTLISITFFSQKYEKLLHGKSSHLFNKNISVCAYKVMKHLTS